MIDCEIVVIAADAALFADTGLQIGEDGRRKDFAGALQKVLIRDIMRWQAFRHDGAPSQTLRADLRGAPDPVKRAAKISP